MQAKGYAWAFEGTRALLAEGDLSVANLETPVTDRKSPFKKRFTYRMPTAALAAIRDANIGLVSLGNNHTGDQGPQGLVDTLSALDAAGIAHAGGGSDLAGARTPAVVEVRGLRVGFLSYSLTYPDGFWATARRPGTAFGHEAWVREDVARLRAQVDLVLVAFHWGKEKHETPEAYQRVLARAAVEAGADAVIGHHPHVLQGVELVDGHPVLYSMGNYAFGSGSGHAKVSAVARLVVDGRRLVRVEMIPLHVRNSVVQFNPRVAEGALRDQTLATLDRLSRALGTAGETRDGRYVVVLPAPAPAPPVAGAVTLPEGAVP